MIIDSHTHLGRNEHINVSVDELLRSMDAAKIDKALVFAGKLNNHPNEDMYKNIAPHQDRLYGIAAWHPNDTQHDLFLLERSIEEGKVQGVKFYLGYDHWYPTDLRIYDVLEILQEKKIPAIFHCGDCLCTVQQAKLKYAHPLGIDEVAVDHPNLKIVIAHMAYPWERDAAEVCYKNKNVFADVSGFVYGAFDAKNIVDFKKVLDEFTTVAGGTDKLLFGSDFPISNQKSYVETIDDLIGMKTISENIHKVFNLL